MYETKYIEQAVVSVHQHSEIGEKVLVVHSYINYKGKMILTKEEALLLLVELHKFVKMKEDEEVNDKIIATEKDAEVFYKAVLGNSTPNENLVEAAKLYKSKKSKVGTLSTCKCNYTLTTEQGHRVIKCLKCGDVKPI